MTTNIYHLSTVSLFIIFFAYLSYWGAYTLLIISNWKIYTKAGRPGWISIIPVYANYTIYEIAWKTAFFWVDIPLRIIRVIMWHYIQINFTQYTLTNDLIYVEKCIPLFIILLIVGITLFVITAILRFKIGRSFGKSTRFCIGMIFLGIIFIPILGLGKAQYVKIQDSKQNTLID